MLSTSDSLIAICIVTPLVVAFWRGTWSLMDQNSNIFPAINCFFLGGAFHLSFAILRDVLSKTVIAKNRTIVPLTTSHVIRKFYTYVFALSCVMHWRGTWGVLEMFCEFSALYTTIVTSCAVVGLAAMKSLKNTSAPPISVSLDCEDTSFTFPTRFEVKVSFYIFLNKIYFVIKKINLKFIYIRTFTNTYNK